MPRKQIAGIDLRDAHTTFPEAIRAGGEAGSYFEISEMKPPTVRATIICEEVCALQRWAAPKTGRSFSGREIA